MRWPAYVIECFFLLKLRPHLWTIDPKRLRALPISAGVFSRGDEIVMSSTNLVYLNPMECRAPTVLGSHAQKTRLAKWLLVFVP
jgi:hypothetical protein